MRHWERNWERFVFANNNKELQTVQPFLLEAGLIFTRDMLHNNVPSLTRKHSSVESTDSAKPVKRRALGDITNIADDSDTNVPSVKKPATSMVTEPSY